MIALVDTSVWVQHFRVGLPDLTRLLFAGDVLLHPVVVGELAVGGLRNRPQTLADLRALPRVSECPTDQALDLIEQHRLYGIGLSWGDVQILASAMTNAIPIWTFDVALHLQAQTHGLVWTP